MLLLIVFVSAFHPTDMSEWEHKKELQSLPVRLMEIWLNESTGWEVEEIKDLPGILSAPTLLNFHSLCFR